jgi:hypothetical protein
MYYVVTAFIAAAVYLDARYGGFQDPKACDETQQRKGYDKEKSLNNIADKFGDACLIHDDAFTPV